MHQNAPQDSAPHEAKVDIQPESLDGREASQEAERHHWIGDPQRQAEKND